eukprot:scaffold92448_cov49-Phaeocystis_antarctica.AAC.2
MRAETPHAPCTLDLFFKWLRNSKEVAPLRLRHPCASAELQSNNNNNNNNNNCRGWPGLPACGASLAGGLKVAGGTLEGGLHADGDHEDAEDGDQAAAQQLELRDARLVLACREHLAEHDRGQHVDERRAHLVRVKVRGRVRVGVRVRVRVRVRARCSPGEGQGQG